MNIKLDINKELENAFGKLGYDKAYAFATESDRPELCDYQCNGAFSLAKVLKTNPRVVAQSIIDAFESEKFELDLAGAGFINVKVKDRALVLYAEKLLNDDRLGIEKNSSKKIIIDYGGANIAKPLHVGHLRSAVIGQAIKNLSKFMGDEIIGDVHLGDWGLQMGLTIAGIMEESDCGAYFGEDKPKPHIDIELLNRIYPEASKRSKEDEVFKKKAQEITVKLQSKQDGYFQIWQDIKQASLKDVKKDYASLNVDFERWNGESDAESYVPKLMNILESKSLIKDSEGAKIVEVALPNDNKPMPPVLIKSTTGAELYATTDLATILSRAEDEPDEIWYLTDARQSLHFEQVFRVARLAKLIPDEVELRYIPFGTMNGSDGKPFKTRAGGTMRLADLVTLLKDGVSAKLKENDSYNETLAHNIALSALKFGDMQNYPSKNYVFDPDRFNSFEGKTGPYLLYTTVRIKSILSKCDVVPKFSFRALSELERKLILSCIKLSEDFKLAYDEKAPSYIANSIYSIASLVSSIYNSVHIISLEEEGLKASYLAVFSLALRAIELGLQVLGINSIERM